VAPELADFLAEIQTSSKYQKEVHSLMLKESGVSIPLIAGSFGLS
jgi:hypothetical protein